MIETRQKTKRADTIKVFITEGNEIISWKHPGGKFLRAGPEKCTDSELLAILIGAGAPGRTAEQIAAEILKTYQSFRGLAGQPLDKLTKIRGLKMIKAVRIAAAFEIARRIVKQILKKND